LIAQRDLLRKAKEIKRKEEMEEFKQKTETKADLFNELKNSLRKIKMMVVQVKMKKKKEKQG